MMCHLTKQLLIGSAGLLLMLLLMACDIPADDATEVPREPSLRPSQTVVPIVVKEPTDAFIGRSDPTRAGLAAEGQLPDNPEVTALPTDAFVPLDMFAADGVLLNLNYYGSGGQSSGTPLVVLLHDENENAQVWNAYAQQLHDLGYRVLVPDLRGRGESEGRFDVAQVVADLNDTFANFLPGLDITRDESIAMIGTGLGADLAVIMCAEHSLCRTAIAISPGIGIEGISTTGAAAQFRGRSLFIISADDDPVGTAAAETLNNATTSDHQWQRFSFGGRGGELFGNQLQLRDIINEWLRQRMPPA
jgi:pimeloyl-ACP methyl ester carboxylesterase